MATPIVSVGEIAESIVSSFDSDYYLPTEPYEDDEGHCYGYGTNSATIEIDEEGFYAKLDIDLTADMWDDPGDYWTPPDSGCEITSLTISLIKAFRIDEDGNECNLSEEELKELESLIKKYLEIQ